MNKRILVYNPDKAYVYVYSIDNGTWGKMDCKILYDINSYPDALGVVDTLQNGRKELVSFSNMQFEGSISTLLITRPLKLDVKEIYKTVKAVMQRGRMSRTGTNQILYGSQDLINWLPVWSSTESRMTGLSGTPYRYYILVVLSSLDAGSYIQGCDVDFITRLTNKLR